MLPAPGASAAPPAGDVSGESATPQIAPAGTPPGVSPGPGGQPAGSTSDWLRAPTIEQPAGFLTVLKDANGNPVTTCAPCHPPVDTVMTDVTDGPAGLVAVGWVLQGFKGAVWHSSDGMTWTLDSQFPTREKTILQAVAVNAGRYVAVGLDGQGATTWSSTDGMYWQESISPAAFRPAPMRLTSVVPWRGGFVAGGYLGTEFGTATAAFWISADGRAWTRIPDAPGLHDARVTAVARGGPGLVAVGTAGAADAKGPAVAWTSSDGTHWSRVPGGDAFQGAVLHAVCAVGRAGLVAVGEERTGHAGVVLLSADGRHWTRLARTGIGRPDLMLRLFDVTAGGAGVIAVGVVNNGVQYGYAGIWTSPDARTWTQVGETPALADGEIAAIAQLGSGLVAVGDRGAPDTYIATVWIHRGP